MNPANTTWRERKDQWGIPVALAVAAGLAMLALSRRVSLPEAPAALRQEETVQAGGDSGAAPSLAITRTEWLPVGSEARERLRLLDPTPLFMPGKWEIEVDAGVPPLNDRPGGEVAMPFAPSLVFSDVRPAREVLVSRVVGTPLEAASLVALPRWFRGMARMDGEQLPETVNRMSGRVDVYLVGAAGILQTFAYEAATIASDAPWRPVELQVLVDEAGEVVAPMVKTSSGVETVDERVCELTRDEWLPRLLLRPGNYRLVVGP